jgi:predicted metal-binding protein
MSESVLWVCVSCREKGGPADLEQRPGFRLHQRLTPHLDRLAEAGVRLEGHRCLSACDRPCAVGFSGSGRWSYVFGRLDETEAVEALLACARLYASSRDGFLERSVRPEALQATIVSRLPPV